MEDQRVGTTVVHLNIAVSNNSLNTKTVIYHPAANMFFIYFLALWATLFTSTVTAHMTLASPVPFGDPTTSPLSSDGSNFPCQITGDAATFYSSTSDSANNTMAIGATQSLSFHGSAVHGGGSCQLALTSDLAPTSSSVWQVILSIEGGCPTTDGSGPSTYDYTIPSSITAGKYVFAWTWISKLSGAPEYYMNCAPVTVTGSSSKREAEASDIAIEERDTSALPNLFVANLASINSCKTTTSTDVVFPDPGPNVSKPSKMTTNFQSPAGSDCFPLGGSSSGGSSSGSSSSAAASAPAATSSAATGATTFATSSTLVPVSSSKSSGGVFVTVSTPAAGTTSAAASTSAPAAVSTTAIATASVGTTSAAPAATSSAGNGTSTGGSSGGSGLSGACTNEGIFNCVGGSQYQQCASGSWTTLRPMPAGTTCQTGESNTLWARGAARARRIRRAL
ncbi:dna-directed rna polymerase [Ophiostoma piceae UAMH 11346]|uniref:Dna-directed rna polymerase n=1 Tax=Ophiostoma piceae (strain UAMH 11346) TaxID=1262450 RepID=S3CD57_OPHP1|nr:dna-directed rna polymerase [Ophiostoma piceae UAMH 11346]